MHLLLQTTQPVVTGWTPEAITTLVGVLVTAIIAVIGAWKGLKADAKADVNSQRITNTAAHVQSVDNKQTDLAEKVGQATVTANAARDASNKGSLQ